MRVISLLLLLLVTAFTGHGQHTNTRKYLDENLHFTSKKHAVYQARVKPDSNHWVLEAMYPGGGRILRMSFADGQLSIKDGLYTIYYSNGQIWMEGRFIHNKAMGVWQCWYNNGQLRDSGRVDEDHFSGQWKHWYAGGQLKKVHGYLAFPVELPAAMQADSSSLVAANTIDTLTAGHLTVSGISDGHWQSWYENGQLECDGVASHGVPAGTWKWFRENGQPASIETYSRGKIVQLECYDEQGVLTGNSCSVLKPAVFTHPTLSAGEYIARVLLQQYSINHHDVGSAQIRFTVTKTGKIKRLVIAGLNDAIVQYNILHILNTMPAWSPAISHNRTIDYEVSLKLY